jgi:hypothetical protein
LAPWRVPSDCRMHNNYIVPNSISTYLDEIYVLAIFSTAVRMRREAPMLKCWPETMQ